MTSLALTVFACIQALEEENAAIQAILAMRLREQIRTRNYLKDMSLTTPEKSAWAKLYRDGDDQAFISSFGLNRAGFSSLLTEFEKHYRVKYGTVKGGRPTRVSNCQALGMVLQFYAAPMELKTLSLLHGVPLTTASRTLQKAEVALSFALREHPLASVKWPSREERVAYAQMIQLKYPTITGRFGFVDGKNFRVQEPADTDVQNALYNGWLHSPLITGVLCFSVAGLLIWSKHNCVGSWNDGDMSRELQERLLHGDFCQEDEGIVADTAFPVGKALVGRIISPLKENELEKAHPDAQPALLHLSSSITSLRQACEWGVGSIEKVWRQLALPLPFNPEIRQRRLNNLFRLWNFRVRTTGISQIRSTFMENEN
jgi:hypothetical protein